MSTFNSLLSQGLVVDLSVADVKEGVTFSIYTGTYPTTEDAKESQRVEDVAAIEMEKASLLTTTSILGVIGTYNESGRNVDPGVWNVLAGKAYKVLGADKVGTFVAPVGRVTHRSSPVGQPNGKTVVDATDKRGDWADAAPLDRFVDWGEAG